MRFISTMAGVLLIAARAAAQDVAKTPAATRPDIPLVNQIDLGIRGTVFGSGSDEARFQRYRDLRNGGLLDRLRMSKETDAYRYTVQADNVGYRDQRYAASYQNYGRLKADVEWNQIPLFYSNETRTLYDQSSPGQLALSDSVQSGIQNKTLTLATALGGASLFDLRTRRDVASVAVTYSATPSVDLGITFRNTQKTGAYRGAAASGSAARSRPSCPCRSITGPPSSAPASSTRPSAASPASATTARSSTTRSPP